MKNLYVTTVIFAAFTIILASCGGGGSSGGGGGPANVVTKLYLFGTMSSNSIITSVFSNISAPNFKDYSAPTSSASGRFPLRSGVLKTSGPMAVSMVDGHYDTVSKKLDISLINSPANPALFLNLSSSTTKNSGKGTEIATLTMKPGTTLASTDKSPTVGKQRIVPVSIGYLNGCKVNYAP